MPKPGGSLRQLTRPKRRLNWRRQPAKKTLPLPIRNCWSSIEPGNLIVNLQTAVKPRMATDEHGPEFQIRRTRNPKSETNRNKEMRKELNLNPADQTAKNPK